MWKKDVSCKTLKSYYSKERMRKDKTRNFDFNKAAERYANTGQSKGTETRGLVQGPGAPGWVEGKLYSCCRGTMAVWGFGEGAGTLELLRAVLFTSEYRIT